MSRIRRTVGAAGVVVATVAACLVLAQQPAAAATTWYLSPTGNNAAACTSPATACLTINAVLAKPAFLNGDTINVAPGTYTVTTAAQRASITRPVIIQRDPATSGAAIFDGANVAGNSIFTVNAAGGEVTLRDLTIQRGNQGSIGFGPGLLVFAGTVHAERVDFLANVSAASFGGAVTVGSGTTFTDLDGSYDLNRAANGGAVAVLGATPTVAAGTATFTNTEFTRNTAPGGAVAGAGNGGAIYNSGTTTITGGRFTGNGVVQSSNGNARRGHGGAIFNGPTDAADAPVLAISGTTFDGAPPAGPAGFHATAGGAIANVPLLGSTVTPTTPGHLDADGITIQAGRAIIGGGLYNTATAELTDSTVQGNTAETFPGISLTGTGGGIFSLGTLDLAGSTIADNTARFASGTASTGLGGGIYSQTGALTVADTTFSGNRAIGDSMLAAASGLGGGLFAFGSPTEISGSTFDANEAPGNGGAGGGAYILTATADLVDTAVTANDAAQSGGGLHLNASTVTIDGGSVAGNATGAGALALGGGISSNGSLGLDGTVVEGNTATSGGGIANSGTLTGTGVELVGNTALGTADIGTGLGGGLLNSATATLTASSVTDNAATGGGAAATGLGGGAFSGGASASLSLDESRVTGNEATTSTGIFQSGWGGAIYLGSNSNSTNSTLRVDRSTIDANTAATGSALLAWAPGASSQARTSIRRSTVSGNPTTLTGGAAIALSTASSLTLSESTLVGEGADVILAVAGGAVARVSGSILTGGDAACAVGAGSTLTDNGHNLANGAGCGFAGPSGNPLLGPLQANGGATPTHLPEAASPALDEIPPATAAGVDVVTGAPVTLCTVPDQRGVSRPQGAQCDIGSVEVGQQAPVIAGPTTGTFTVGTPGTLAEHSATGVPVPTISASGLPSGLTFEATGPAAGQITGTPAAGTGGVHNVTVTATNEAGIVGYPVELTVNEAPTITAGPTQLDLVETVPAATATYTATGYPVPNLTLSGTLPDGLTFNPGAGSATITGTPDADTAGTYTVVVTASNGIGAAATRTVVIEVAPVLTITTTELPAGSVGIAYDADVAAIGGATPYDFEVVAGTLPAGLTLAEDGSVTGTPTATGTSTFTVRATDSTEPTPQVDEQELSITIDPGPTTIEAHRVVFIRNPLGVRIGIVGATLVGGDDTPLAGKTVTFTAGRQVVCTGVTDAQGEVLCAMTPGATVWTILALGVRATFDGDATWLPSTDKSGL